MYMHIYLHYVSIHIYLTLYCLLVYTYVYLYVSSHVYSLDLRLTPVRVLEMHASLSTKLQIKALNLMVSPVEALHGFYHV